MSFLSDSDVAPKANIGQSRLVLIILHIMIVNWPFCIFQSVSKHQMCFTSSEDKFLYLCTYIVYWCLHMSFCLSINFHCEYFINKERPFGFVTKFNLLNCLKVLWSLMFCRQKQFSYLNIWKLWKILRNSSSTMATYRLAYLHTTEGGRSHVLTKATVWPESHNIHMSQNLDLDSFWHLLHYFNSWQRKVHPDQGWQTHALL